MSDADPSTMGTPTASLGGGSRRLGPVGRRLVLLGFSMLVAVAFLGLLEGVLRLAGYGGYPPTFSVAGTLPDGSKLVFSDHGGPTSYFFANRTLPGSLDPAAFVSPKPAKTFRVFVVGESAAKGNPYPRPVNWSAMLEAMLAKAWPERKVEVINLGTTAVASFPVLGIATEALDYEPDLVIAYIGNNEFYGAYGVASLHSAGRSPAMLRFVRAAKWFAVAQFLDAKFYTGPRGDPSKTLMEAMVGRSYLGPNDPARADAARNLETFVGTLVERCQARHVPVVVCTPPANERGLAPLGAADLSSLAKSPRAEVGGMVAAARDAMATKPREAEQAARGAIKLAPDHALAHHLLGRALFEQKRFEESAAEFRKAVDLDPMPWRPPSGSVAAVRRAAQRGGGAGVILCDLEAALRERSPGGSIGWEFMDDHVHASFDGQYEIAKAIVRSLQAAPAMGVPKGAAEAIDEPTLGAMLGDNSYERYAAAYAMRRLAGVPFFKETNPLFFERHNTLCRSIEAGASPMVMAQIRKWQDPATHEHDLRPIGGLVGYALHEEGRNAEAEPLFRVAAGSVMPYGSWELEYTYMAIVCRQAAHGGMTDVDRAEARRAIERGRVSLSLSKSRSGGLELYTGLLHQLCGGFAESVEPLEAAHQKLSPEHRLLADEPLAEAYLRTGKPERAAALLDAGVNAGGRAADEYRRVRRRLLNR